MWKLLSSRLVLKISRENLKEKAQIGQYMLVVVLSVLRDSTSVGEGNKIFLTRVQKPPLTDATISTSSGVELLQGQYFWVHIL